MFTVCDDARGFRPTPPGQPLTAHWGIEDPAAVAGPEFLRRAAFERALGSMRRRIDAVAGLPLDGLDHLSLASRLKDIGDMGGFTSSRPPVA